MNLTQIKRVGYSVKEDYQFLLSFSFLPRIENMIIEKIQ